jgi:hypothetical protein
LNGPEIAGLVQRVFSTKASDEKQKQLMEEMDSDKSGLCPVLFFSSFCFFLLFSPLLYSPVPLSLIIRFFVCLSLFFSGSIDLDEFSYHLISLFLTNDNTATVEFPDQGKQVFLVVVYFSKYDFRLFLLSVCLVRNLIRLTKHDGAQWKELASKRQFDRAVEKKKKEESERKVQEEKDAAERKHKIVVGLSIAAVVAALGTAAYYFGVFGSRSSSSSGKK